MITTQKKYPRYNSTCSNCGNETQFASNQKAGKGIMKICECFSVGGLTIPEPSEPGQRSTQKPTQKLRSGILRIFGNIRRAMTVRQVYYRAVVGGLIKKDAAGYSKVQTQLLDMRREGLLPYSFITDGTRSYIKPDSFNSMKDALDTQLNNFRISLWKDINHHVEIWLEKDALKSIFLDVTVRYDVPLFVSRGFASESFIYGAAEEIKRTNKPTTIYFFSDYDPSGIELSDSVEAGLKRFGVDVNFIRMGLTKDQVSHFKLQTRETKRTKKKPYDWFKGDSCELDALHPDDLIALVGKCISNHISNHEIQITKIEEQTQKRTLETYLNNLPI